MDFLEEAIRRIEAQQPAKRNTVWLCAEQLKGIVRAEPALAELVAQDLENKGMSVAACEQKIRAAARASGGGLTGPEAEEVIRRFYGLPEGGAAEGPRTSAAGGAKEESGAVDLADFF